MVAPTIRTVRRRVFAAALATALIACGGGGEGGPAGPGPGPGPGPDPNPPPGGTTVVLTAGSFSPASLTVARNATVTWTNSSGVLHNVTFATGGAPANIPNHSSGSNERNFPTAGTFNYSCTLHSGMDGAIVVQ